MTATPNRFSLSTLFLIAVAFAAYQSGRLKEDEYSRSLRIAEADAASLRAHNKTLEQLARTWKSIALNSRPLASSKGRQFRRWNINTMSLSASDYLAKLDDLGIQLLTISHSRELHVLSHFSTSPRISLTQQVPECGGIVQGGSREEALVMQSGLREVPIDVLILLPSALVDVLEAEELAGAQLKGLRVSQIQETSFAIIQSPSEPARSVIVRSIRPISNAMSSN